MNVKQLSIYIVVTLGLVISSCKEECIYDCSDNADCIKGSCECKEADMYKILAGTSLNPSKVRCMPPHLFEGAYTYRPLAGSSCLCAEDIVLSFFHCFSNGGGLVGPCSSHILHMDTDIGMYRNNTVPITSIFPVNEEEEDRLVFVEWGARNGQAMPFCRDLTDLGGVIFRGLASRDLDTIDMNLVYYDHDLFVVRDSCPVTFLRVKKSD